MEENDASSRGKAAVQSASDDPFAALISFSRTTSSQEQIWRSQTFAYHYEGGDVSPSEPTRVATEVSSDSEVISDHTNSLSTCEEQVLTKTPALDTNPIVADFSPQTESNVKKSKENLGLCVLNTEEDVVIDEGKIRETKACKLEMEKIDESVEITEGKEFNSDPMEVDTPIKESDGKGSTDDNISSSGKEKGGVAQRRRLPLSMSVKRKNVADNVSSKGRNLDKVEKQKDLNNFEEKEDWFETLKRRGLEFERPRWWPPEGFD